MSPIASQWSRNMTERSGTQYCESLTEVSLFSMYWMEEEAVDHSEFSAGLLVCFCQPCSASSFPVAEKYH